MGFRIRGFGFAALNPKLLNPKVWNLEEIHIGLCEVVRYHPPSSGRGASAGETAARTKECSIPVLGYAADLEKGWPFVEVAITRRTCLPLVHSCFELRRTSEGLV